MKYNIGWGVKSDHTDCSALRASTILPNIRISWGLCLRSASVGAKLRFTGPHAPHFMLILGVSTVLAPTLCKHK